MKWTAKWINYTENEKLKDLYKSSHLHTPCKVTIKRAVNFKIKLQIEQILLHEDKNKYWVNSEIFTYENIIR